VTTTALFELQLQVDRYLANLTKADQATKGFGGTTAKVNEDAAKGFDRINNATARGALVAEAAAKKQIAAMRSLNADIERGVASYERQASAAEASAERQAKATERVQKKMAIAAAASIVAWKEFFAFLETGSGEGAASFKHLHEEFNSFTSDVAEATADGSAMQALNALLSTIMTGAQQSEAAINALGEAIGALAAPPAAAAQGLADFLNMASGGRLGAMPAPNRGTPGSGPSVAARAEAARLAGLGETPTLPTVLDELVITPGRGGRGGGSRGARSSGPASNNVLSALDLNTRTGGLGDMAEESAPTRLANEWAAAVDTVRPAMKEYNDALVATSEKGEWFTERAAQQSEKRIALMQNEVAAIAQFATSAGKALGMKESGIHMIEATSEGIQAGIAWAKVLDPLGGEAYIPEALAHSAMVIDALAAAANPASPRGVKGGGGGGGAGAPGAGSFAPPPAAGAGGGAQSVVVKIDLWGTRREFHRFLTETLGDAHDGGMDIPARATRRRR